MARHQRPTPHADHPIGRPRGPRSGRGPGPAGHRLHRCWPRRPAAVGLGVLVASDTTAHSPAVGG